MGQNHAPATVSRKIECGEGLRFGEFLIEERLVRLIQIAHHAAAGVTANGNDHLHSPSDDSL